MIVKRWNVLEFTALRKAGDRQRRRSALTISVDDQRWRSEMSTRADHLSQIFFPLWSWCISNIEIARTLDPKMDQRLLVPVFWLFAFCSCTAEVLFDRQHVSPGTNACWYPVEVTAFPEKSILVALTQSKYCNGWSSSLPSFVPSLSACVSQF